ncbi:MAG: DUF6291 domain-containing protein [bacterium]
MKRDSFIFYRSFYEAISDLPDKEQLDIYKAISEFSLNFQEPELTGISATIFKLVKPQLVANNKRFENGTKPKKKQKGSRTKAKRKQNKNKIEANNNVNVNDNVNKNDNTWRNDFEIYKSELREVYKELLNDSKFISEQEKFHPGVDIKLSLEKACTNFWATEAGWKHKKKQRSKEINWKTTLTNAIDLNKVYKPKNFNPVDTRTQPDMKNFNGKF